MSEELIKIEPDTDNSQIEDVSSSTWEYISAHYMVYVILFLFFCVVVFYFAPTIPTIFILAILGSWGYSFAYKKVKREFTQEFGRSIGFTYMDSSPIESVSGKLFSTGHDRSISDVLSGVYQNIPMQIFTFRFTIGSGKSSHTYSYTVIEATLTGTVPHILLFSKIHNSVVSDWFSEDETINLEGDFNKYFTLRVPEGHGQEAFQIFTPDVMTKLIDMAYELSFEFIGNKLYIYAVRVITKRDDFQNMFDLSKYLISLFNKNTQNINET